MTRLALNPVTLTLSILTRNFKVFKKNLTTILKPFHKALANLDKFIGEQEYEEEYQKEAVGVATQRMADARLEIHNANKVRARIKDLISG